MFVMYQSILANVVGLGNPYATSRQGFNVAMPVIKRLSRSFPSINEGIRSN
jgi:hypothetical protein